MQPGQEDGRNSSALPPESLGMSWEEARRFILETLAESHDIALRLETRIEWLQFELHRLRRARLEIDERLDWFEQRLDELAAERRQLESAVERPLELAGRLEERSSLFPSAGDPQVLFSQPVTCSIRAPEKQQ